jgi:hypothetical protein
MTFLIISILHKVSSSMIVYWEAFFFHLFSAYLMRKFRLISIAPRTFLAVSDLPSWLLFLYSSSTNRWVLKIVDSLVNSLVVTYYAWLIWLIWSDSLVWSYWLAFHSRNIRNFILISLYSINARSFSWSSFVIWTGGFYITDMFCCLMDLFYLRAS